MAGSGHVQRVAAGLQLPPLLPSQAAFSAMTEPAVAISWPGLQVPATAPRRRHCRAPSPAGRVKPLRGTNEDKSLVVLPHDRRHAAPASRRRCRRRAPRLHALHRGATSRAAGDLCPQRHGLAVADHGAEPSGVAVASRPTIRIAAALAQRGGLAIDRHLDVEPQLARVGNAHQGVGTLRPHARLGVELDHDAGRTRTQHQRLLHCAACGDTLDGGGVHAGQAQRRLGMPLSGLLFRGRGFGLLDATLGDDAFGEQQLLALQRGLRAAGLWRPLRSV